MSRKTELYIDFDHTLFDTDFFFWTDVKNFLNNQGVSTELIMSTYFSIQTNGYTIQNHLGLMKIEEARIQEITQSFDQKFQSLYKYLFPDASNFLEITHVRKDTKLILLSFGNPEWQKMKVGKSGVNNYFDSVIFTAKENSKGEAIQAYHQAENDIIVIDNSPKELDKIIEKIPAAKTFLLAPRLPNDFFALKTLLENQLFFELRRYVVMEPQFPHQKVYSLMEISNYI